MSLHSDMTEGGLETIMVNHLISNNGYEQGTSADYNREYGMELSRLERFLRATQPQKVEETMIYSTPSETRKFLTRLSDALSKRGVVDVLRKGFRYNGQVFDMYYPIPSPHNTFARKMYDENIFCVTRQLHCCEDETRDALDVCVSINGMPVATFELKNHYTGQTVENAVRQYREDRSPKDKIFAFRRCAVHFAVDDDNIRMCTQLKGKDSWFLPFDKGLNGGAGNPVNPNGMRTAYLWEEILTKASLSDIVENFAQIVKEKDPDTQEEKEKNIWPRYHQLNAVRYLLKDSQSKPIGQRYLIQHSAGSGKSNTITWLAYQLVTLQRDNEENVVDSVIVVTDRVNLDKQIRDNIKAFGKMQNNVAWADSSSTLTAALQSGKNIIITTVHKFKFILEAIGTSMKDYRFAIIIDEAHSSQSGNMNANMNMAVSGSVDSEEEDIEDKIASIIEGRKMAKNVNYYAFTATPKNKTLQMFGTSLPPTPEGEIQHVPFHEYTMKQAIDEGFILDVLRNYTPYKSYYKIIKATSDDPEFDKKSASKKLRAYVEAQPETIEQKSHIIVEHFLNKTSKKIGGQARAMVVTAGIERAIEFYFAIKKKLEEFGSPYKPIVAYTGEKLYMGKMVSESDINGFPSSQIEKTFKKDPYRLLVVADKFQTGFDEPLLHTMYVDKVLSDVKAVQTLSRLNRCYPKKTDTFVLDFVNEPQDITVAFQKYYKGTILTHETDPNRLNDLIETVEEYSIYTSDELQEFNRLYWGNAPRTDLDPIVDTCVERFKTELDKDAQISCKSNIKGFIRIYPFLAAIMPFRSKEWEETYQFYYYLHSKLPKIMADDWTEGLVESVDFDKYRIVAQEEVNISLLDQNAEIEPIPVSTGGGTSEPDLDKLSNIIEEFNEVYGGIEWEHPDTVRHQIEELPERLLKNDGFVNAFKHAGRQTAQIQGSEALYSIVIDMMDENTEFARNYLDNENFRAFINNRVFSSIEHLMTNATPGENGATNSEEAQADNQASGEERTNRQAPNKQNTLYLTIKQVYFDQIVEGTKKEEYRNITDTTYKKYLQCDVDGNPFFDEAKLSADDPNAGDPLIWNNGVYPYIPKEYKYLNLAVGYAKERDSALVEVTSYRFMPDTLEDGKPVRLTLEGDTLKLDANGDLCNWIIAYQLGEVVELHRKQ